MSTARTLLGFVGDVIVERADPLSAFDTVGAELADLDYLFGNHAAAPGSIDGQRVIDYVRTACTRASCPVDLRVDTTTRLAGVPTMRVTDRSAMR